MSDDVVKRVEVLELADRVSRLEADLDRIAAGMSAQVGRLLRAAGLAPAASSQPVIPNELANELHALHELERLVRTLDGHDPPAVGWAFVRPALRALDEIRKRGGG